MAAIDKTVIEDAATSPKDAVVDGVHVEQRTIAELIEADRYNESKAQSRKRGFPVRRQVVDPPGAV